MGEEPAAEDGNKGTITSVIYASAKKIIANVIYGDHDSHTRSHSMLRWIPSVLPASNGSTRLIRTKLTTPRLHMSAGAGRYWPLMTSGAT